MSKKDVRAAFRYAVFTRDQYKCQICGHQYKPEECDPAAGNVNAHHITDRSLMPNGGYVVENGITVCEVPCHLIVEEWHIQGYDVLPRQPGYNAKLEEPFDDRPVVLKHFQPEALYKLIGSSYERAIAASKRLT